MVWHGNGFTTNCCPLISYNQLSLHGPPCSFSLCPVFEKVMGSSIFSCFSFSYFMGVNFFTALLKPWDFSVQLSAECCLRGDCSLHWPPHPTPLSDIMVISHTAQAPKPCCLLLPFLLPTLYFLSFPGWWLAAGRAHADISSHKMDFLEHIFDLKLFVCMRVGPAANVAKLQEDRSSLRLFSKELSVSMPDNCSHILNHQSAPLRT